MKTPDFIVIKKKKSPVAAIIIIACSVVAAAAAAVVVYKMYGEKIKAKVNALIHSKTNVLAEVDIDGDGEADALILDTTGDGEVDTIILNEVCETEE